MYMGPGLASPESGQQPRRRTYLVWVACRGSTWWAESVLSALGRRMETAQRVITGGRLVLRQYWVEGEQYYVFGGRAGGRWAHARDACWTLDFFGLFESSRPDDVAAGIIAPLASTARPRPELDHALCC